MLFQELASSVRRQAPAYSHLRSISRPYGGSRTRMNAHIEPEAPVSSRRSVLVAAIYGFVSLISAALGIPALLYLFVPPRARNQGAWVDAGTIDQFEANKPQEV